MADNAVAPSDELLGDASATGLAAPANAAAAEAAQQAALPAATGGLGWTMDVANRAALFGPAGTPAFSIQCQKQREAPSQLVFIRYMTPTAGGNATLSFTGNGQAASVPIAASQEPRRRGRPMARGDRARRHRARRLRDLQRPGPVDVSISGMPSLVVPAAAEPRRVFADCLGG